ncbi:MAG: hypothetical protein CME63_07110 [Halobacteriovoraceae bacterium]|nr:hypothetical protein [Halobacteriovoraceae bacterium]MBC97501.1 hypothetical protein [Halobacteriovoraceae bacterium]|tara:strand:- start:77306 stop:78289 length:984 start_codon:yes stop_codon:yes gene_type:complete
METTAPKKTKTNRPLDGLTVLDFTSRLPGPLAGYILEQLGAQVIKIESESHPDPFKNLKLGVQGREVDDVGFESWYKNMNKNKENFILTHENTEQLQSLCKKAHMVIMGWPKKVQEKYSVTFEDLSSLSGWGSYVELTASHYHERPLHDLNIMADQGLLGLHIKQWEKKNKTAKRIAPPFLPIAGATFAQSITQNLLACALKGLMDQNWIYQVLSLEESIEKTWQPLYAPDLQGVQESFLHSGRYPCYNIYPLKNHRAHLAIACIEEKFWTEFTTSFEIELSAEDRFNDKDEEVFTAIQTKIAEYDVETMQEKLKGLNCCLSLVLKD